MAQSRQEKASNDLRTNRLSQSQAILPKDSGIALSGLAPSDAGASRTPSIRSEASPSRSPSNVSSPGIYFSPPVPSLPPPAANVKQLNTFWPSGREFRYMVEPAESERQGTLASPLPAGSDTLSPPAPPAQEQLPLAAPLPPDPEISRPPVPPADEYEGLLEASGFPDQLTSEHIRQILRSQRRVFKLLDTTLRLRTTIETDQQRLEHNQRFYNESIAAFMEAQDRAMNQQSLSNEELKALHEQCKADAQALKEQQEVVKDYLNSLNNLDYRVMNEGGEFAGLLKGIAGVLGMEIADLQTLSTTGSPGGAAPTETPSLLSRYYDRQGDVGVAQDRLDEFDHAHRDEMVDRDFRLDQDQELLISDEEFEAAYQTERRQLLADLQAAQTDATRLALLCEESGIAIESPRAMSENPENEEETMRAFDWEVLPTPAPPPPHLLRDERNVPSTVLASIGRQRRAGSPEGGRPPLVPKSRLRDVREWLNDVTAEPLPSGLLPSEHLPSENGGSSVETPTLQPTTRQHYIPEHHLQSAPRTRLSASALKLGGQGSPFALSYREQDAPGQYAQPRRSSSAPCMTDLEIVSVQRSVIEDLRRLA